MSKTETATRNLKFNMNYLLTRTQTILTPEEGWKLISQAQQDLNGNCYISKL